jgi:ABC-type polysaccharide/polyol phosphate transport system ATPase subunit
MSFDRDGAGPAIAVRGVSKRYYIGANRARLTTLAERVVQAVRRPFARDAREVLWALKDCSFDVAKGDLVGIIGRNGAGKSTLLKLLARITEPTAGEILMYGRVGALLEVGTGFHAELTGRENVYLNGTILGMRRREIAARFDEIVAFAEVERFLDTPVKYYSSGMYVRLAFAVAAHLEPEILIVDEVLAVGDSEFQRKCMGKMEQVAQAGRTVLFVSHNMHAIATLTKRTLVLDRGACVFNGATADGIAHYRTMQGSHAGVRGAYSAPPGTSGHHVASARVVTSEAGGVHRCGQPMRFEFELEIPEALRALSFSFEIVDAEEQSICQLWCFDSEARFRRDAGRFRLTFEAPALRAYKGTYTIRTTLIDRTTYTELENLAQLCPFVVVMDELVREDFDWDDGARVYLENHNWTLSREGSADAPQRGGFAL